MKKIIFRLLVAILSLAIGLTSVWLTNLFINKNHLQQNEVVYLKTQALIESTSNEESVMVSRGCGRYGSYSQTYYFKTGSISEGANCSKNAKTANKEFKELLAKAERIVEKTRGVKNRHGKMGERIILEFRDERGENTKILWYDGGKCFYLIEAPKPELALEFEKRLESRK